jgi:hypothetical protein
MDLFLLSRQAHLMEAIFSHLLHAKSTILPSPDLALPVEQTPSFGGN